MAFNFSAWNRQQKMLRIALGQPDQHANVLEASVEQHGWTHEKEVWTAPSSTFADQLWQDLSEQTARRIPVGSEHSIAWIYWHMARIEDTAFNLLVSAGQMVLDRDDWIGKLGFSPRHTGNSMPQAQIVELSKKIDLPALRSYRIAVGKRTREIIQSLDAERLAEKVSAEDIQRVRLQEAILPAAEGLLKYWSRRTIGGLVLMPATRHNMVHLNEALSLKSRPG